MPRKDICPNCSNKMNWYYSVKIETKTGPENVHKCSKCNAYFKASIPYSLFWHFVSLSPWIWYILVPEQYDILKYSVFAILIVLVLVLLLIRARKNKRIIQEKGYWVVIDS